MTTTKTSQRQNGKTHTSDTVKTFPAPRELATPTDLPQEAVETVTNTINPLIADAFALYTKTKNFHWHLTGSHFRDYHKLFDKQAAEILASIDPMAERIRKIGGTTLRSISHISQTQTISDDNDEFVLPQEMIQRLINDNVHIAHALREAVDVIEENKDHATANLLEEILDLTEQRVWFLYEISQGGENQQ